MLRNLEEKASPPWTALLVIDVQNDYCHPEGASARSGVDIRPQVEMVPRLLRLIEAARRAGVFIVYTRNWHSAAMDSEAWAERCARAEERGVMRACLAETWGADFYGVQPQDGEYVLNKFRYDAFLGTSLEFLLRARGIRTVVCAGMSTNICVESTARSAHLRDYYLVLASDCCSASDPELHRATLKNVERHFGVLATAEELEGCWASAPAVALTATRSRQSRPARLASRARGR